MPISEIPSSQLDSPAAQNSEWHQYSTQAPSQETTISFSERRDLYQEPISTRPRDLEAARTVPLNNSETAEIPRNWESRYSSPSTYPPINASDAVTPLRNEQAQRLRSEQVTVSPSRAIEMKTPPTLSMLESYGLGSESPPQFQWWHRAVLGLILLFVVGALGFGGWYWWSHSSSAAQPSVESRNTAEESLSGAPSVSPENKPATSNEAVAQDGTDQEFIVLRERRINAKPSESIQIVAALKDAERKYPNDYRFPYERAKLSIVGIIAHHETFGALALAAEKAIDNGKAEEMLDNLIADKDGDFWKASHGHREWPILEEALRNKDKASLKSLHY